MQQNCRRFLLLVLFPILGLEILVEGAENVEELFLTPLIKSGEFEKARINSQDGINLAKLELGSEVKSFSGYLTIEEKSNSNLFFWFFPAKSDPVKAPLILWVNELPGMTCMRGIFLENGPFYLDENSTLKEREHTWTNEYSMLYIDAPVGTGFSFADDESAYAQSAEDEAAEVYEALRQFFTLFKEFQPVDFYMAGKTYAGSFIPTIGAKIHEENSKSDLKINLKGFIIGSPWIITAVQTFTADYMYSLGLIDGPQFEELMKIEDDLEKAIAKNDTNIAHEISSIIYTSANSLYANFTGFKDFNSALTTKSVDEEIDRFTRFIDSPQMHSILHAGLRKFNGVSIKTALHFTNNFFALNSSGLVQDLLDKGYRALLYAPQFDLFNSPPGILEVVNNLQWSGSQEFNSTARAVWRVRGDVSGYVKEAGNLNFVLLRNAGNRAIQDQPLWVMDMITRFISGKGFKN